MHPVHNSVFLETVMTLSEQGSLNKRHGNTACWERFSSTRASHGLGPGAWSSLAPGGHRLPTGVGLGLGPAFLLGVTVSPLGWGLGLGPALLLGVTVSPLGWAQGLVQPHSWGAPSPHWGGARGLVQPSSWGSPSLGMEWICPPGLPCPPSTKGASCPLEYVGCTSQDALVPKAGSVWSSRSLG